MVFAAHSSVARIFPEVQMPLPPNPNTFANNPLDRAGHLRTDSDWVDAKLKDPHSLFVPLWRLNPLVLPPQKEGDAMNIGWLTRDAIRALNLSKPMTVLLGLEEGGAHFAVDISDARDPANHGPLAGLGAFEDLRGIAGRLAPGDASILAQAKSMIDWHARHGFCAVCGSRTQPGDAGYKRQCDSCKAEHFPRTDPVVIMLATHNGRALLGRQKSWPAKMFSALAGFLEPGESIEEAVARELDEEAGVRVSSVQYHSTQPWPYPSSLMIGCFASAVTDEINVDGIEIAEARWFERETLKAAIEGRGDGSMFVPPPMAIAHQLVKAWVESGA
jgi:NAD+ diphosphatase